jgi:hypothetical protein
MDAKAGLDAREHGRLAEAAHHVFAVAETLHQQARYFPLTLFHIRACIEQFGVGLCDDTEKLRVGELVGKHRANLSGA